jgi:hypothetical protein
VGEGTDEQRLVDLLADHLGKVIDQGTDRPRERGAALGRHEVTLGDPRQPWCSERSAVA